MSALQNSITYANQRAIELMMRQSTAQPAPILTPQVPPPQNPAPAWSGTTPASRTTPTANVQISRLATSVEQLQALKTEIAAVDMSSPDGPKTFMMLQMRANQIMDTLRETEARLTNGRFDLNKEMGRDLR
jgi:hypothetical protein